MPEPQDEQDSNVPPTPEYLSREKRIEDAFNLRKPDRVPIAPAVVHYYPTRANGISNKDAQYDVKATLEIWKETIRKHDWDVSPPYGSLRPAGAMNLLGIQQMKWPGGGLPDDRPFQWVENEYMTQDEYDEILKDPIGFTVKKLWPRVATALTPISDATKIEPPLLPFLSNAYTLPDFLGNLISQPSMTESLEKLLALAQEIKNINSIVSEHEREMKKLGYPLIFGAMTFPAFDWISDTLRGLRGTSLDMYQVPEKLLALIDIFIPLTVQGVIGATQESGINRAFIPLHRGAGGFMSNEQFARFYWPGLKALILGLIDAGITPVPLFEGDYTPRLEFLQELPPAKVVAHYDQVDRQKAKKLLGDTMCFYGNVPASLMCSGTPQQVKDDVKRLIDMFGENGGLVIDSTMGLPDESRPENVQALTDAVFEYGVY
jgi:uroporphyrinogen-III decarboxylase